METNTHKKRNWVKILSFRNIMRSRLFFVIEGLLTILMILSLRFGFIFHDKQIKVLENTARTFSINQPIAWFFYGLTIAIIFYGLHLYESRRIFTKRKTLMDLFLEHISIKHYV